MWNDTYYLILNPLFFNSSAKLSFCSSVSNTTFKLILSSEVYSSSISFTSSKGKPSNPQSSKLDDSLFNNIWDACPTLTESELLELTTEAQRYYGVKAQPFSAAPLDMFMQPQTQGISAELRDKLGIK